MLAGLTLKQWRVQHFRTRACPTATEAVGQVTGLPGRHLDAWLMPPPVCRGLFTRAAAAAELSVVEGSVDESAPRDRWDAMCDHPGRLRPIADILDLPIIAVVSCRESAGGDFHLPRFPEGVDAVLVDELTDPEALPRLARLIRLTSGLPVVGAVDALPEVRRALAKNPRDRRLPDDLVDVLARSFLTYADLPAIAELARRPMPQPVELAGFSGRGRRRFRVAYAQDDAFGRYFPDTIEALEALGADLIEFSPLRDEALPAGVGLVMIGSGFPDQHAAELAANLSMMAALGKHVCLGRRIYSEGGGTAYLGRRMIIGDQTYRGAGILPFDANLLADPPPPAPVSRTLLHDSWLGPRGTVVRGYKSGRWRLTPSIERFECPACFGPLCAEGDWFFHHHAVGSLLHLHLGALPEVVAAFAGPHRPSLRRPTARGLVDREHDHGEPWDDEWGAADS
jgi:cobyrinic acid a,c-diamide synthase